MKLSKILGRPFWSGIGAIVGIIGVIVAIWLPFSADKVSDGKSELSNSIEFNDLLSMFSVTSDNHGTIGALAWDTGASEGSPIKWAHAGLKFIGDISPQEKVKIPKSFGPMFRKGQIIIMNGGKASHFVLKERLKPVAWEIMFFGVRSGADIVRLSNNTLVFPYDDGTGELRPLKKHILESKELCRSDEMLTSVTDVTVSKVKVPNKRPFLMIESSYCGGVRPQCSYEYTLFLQQLNQNQLNEILQTCQDELLINVELND